MNFQRPEEGSATLRTRPAGLEAGGAGSFVRGPHEALGLVARELALAEAALSELVLSDVASVTKIAAYLNGAGGKRLRPALTALGARAIGQTEPMPRLMCAGELIHLGSLLHDDVVDLAETRRGQPAAHRVFGNGVTVLTGDFCLARAVLLAAEEGGHATVTALARAVTEMAEGEVMQLQRAGDLDSDVAGYLEVVDRKSAALIAWCASAAAHRAGDLEAVAALEAYGRGVGVAFQITDDVLDFVEGTGKTPGADLRERKVTLPLIHAMARVPGLRERLGAGPPTAAELPELIAAVRESGALEQARADARGFIGGALQALEILPDTSARQGLAVLGRYLVERTT